MKHTTRKFRIILIFIIAAAFLNFAYAATEENFEGVSWLRPVMLAESDRAMRADKEKAMVNTILAILPSDKVNDTQEIAEYIAAHFGNQWEEALSLMGWHLMDRNNRSLIEGALGRGVSILRLADLLHYKDYYDLGITLTTFPIEFQRLVLENNRPRDYLVVGSNIDALWAVYSTLRANWRDGIKGDSARINKLEELRQSMIDWANSEGFNLFLKEEQGATQQWSDDRLVRKTLKALRSFYQAAIYMKHGSGQTRAGNTKISIAAIEGPFEFSYGQETEAGFQWQFSFSIWLTEPKLLQEITQAMPEMEKHIAYEPRFGKKALHVSSVVYRVMHDNEGIEFQISQLQSWFRLSTTVPAALRKEIGSIEEFTERAFRAHASLQNAGRIIAPGGNQLFKESIDPIHPSTVQRISDIFRTAGYKLVFYEGDWRLQCSLSLLDAVFKEVADQIEQGI